MRITGKEKEEDKPAGNEKRQSIQTPSKVVRGCRD